MRYTCSECDKTGKALNNEHLFTSYCSGHIHFTAFLLQDSTQGA